MTPFANQLKNIRTARHLSQEELVKELYISRQAISKWENDEATPDMEHLVKLAAILEVSLDELVLAKEDRELEQEDENLHLLKGREFTIHPETGQYVKRDGFSIFLDLLSEYWWVLLAVLPWLFIFLQ